MITYLHALLHAEIFIDERASMMVHFPIVQILHISFKRFVPMSEDKTATLAKDNSKEKKSGKKGNKKSLIWIIGVVVLILISLTFVLPTTMFSETSSAISFGSYNGKSIELTNTSYFYYQLQSIYSYYAQYYGESTAQSYSYSIYYSAFQQALINEAFQEMAEKAGFTATNDQIYQAVMDSNYYSDGTNSFSQETYDSATDLQKEQIVAWMKEYVPFQEVQNTILSVPTASAETDFIATLSDETTSVDYIALTSDLYPAEDAKTYAEERADLFKTVTYIRATYATEDEATAAMDEIAAGTKTLSDVVAESTDSAKDNEGRVTSFRYELESDVTDSEKLESIFTSDAKTMIGPVATSEGYTLFYIESAAADPDYSDESVIASVRSYIASNDSDVIKAYLETIKDAVYADAQADFEGAAEKYGVEVQSVSDFALNTGDSQFIYSLNYTSENSSYSGALTNGYIYTQALADTDWFESLFTLESGTVLEPYYANDAYVIARTAESESASSYMGTYLSSMYSYYAAQYGLIDYESKTLSSDKVEDNFFNGYLQAAFGYSTT